MSRTAEPYSTECDLCGLLYMANHRKDERAHRRACDRWMAAVGVLGHEPEHGHKRGATKGRGHDLLKEVDPQQQILGAELVLRAWFDRSLEAAIDEDYWRAHPTLPQYTAMMDLEGHFPEDVVAALRARVGRRTPGIANGASYWLPPVASRRRTPPTAQV